MEEKKIFKKLEKYQHFKGSKEEEKSLKGNKKYVNIVYFENFRYLTNSFQESIKTDFKIDIMYIASNFVNQKIYFLTKNSKFGIYDILTNKYNL
jgi:hypothetical protein